MEKRELLPCGLPLQAKNNNVGFTIIEVITYLAGTMIIFSILLMHFTKTWHILRIVPKNIRAITSLYNGLQRLRLELEHAPSFKPAWISTGEHEILWSLGEEAVSWSFEKEKLIRRQGIFDTAKKVWKKKSKSLIAEHVKGNFLVTYAPITEKKLQQVSCITVAIEASLYAHESFNVHYTVVPWCRIL